MVTLGGVEGMLGVDIQWVGARDAVNVLWGTGQPPTAKNDLTSRVKSAWAEKHWIRWLLEMHNPVQERPYSFLRKNYSLT